MELLERQVAFGPRVPGTESHDRAQAWLLEELRKTTPHVTVEPFTIPDGDRAVSCANLVATFNPGKGDPAVLAAHWDSRPRSEEDVHPEHRELATPGANDGASGVAVVLDVAQALAASAPPREVRLVLFDGEDWGTTPETMFYGSRAYVARHRQDPPAWGILVDMVGQTHLRLPRESMSSLRAGKLTRRVWRMAHELGYGSIFQDRDGPQIMDDHWPFLERGIPFIDVIDFDYAPWHSVHDLPSECSAASLAVVSRVAERALTAR